MKSLYIALLVLIFPLVSFAQKAEFATLYVYHPKSEVAAGFSIYIADSVICKSRYNSIHEIKLYKEGKTALWANPENKNQVIINVKFGEAYFLKCWTVKDETILKPMIKLTDGSEYQLMQADKDSIKARKARKLLDTIPRRNTIYVELCGQALLYSLNYDRLFRVNKKVKHSVSLGLEVIFAYRNFGKWNYWMFMPFSYNFLFGKKNNYLELGVGQTIAYNQYYREWWFWNSVDVYCDRSFFYFISPKIGWRFQPKRGGFFFKAAFSPIINVYSYYAPQRLKSTNELINPSSHGFFDGWWGKPLDYVLPWAGISLGYTFNFKKKK